jgi:hypothetical protein
VIVDAKTKKLRKIFEELVNAGFYYMRMHNDPDNQGTPHKKALSHKRFVKAIEATYEFLEPKGEVIKMKPQVTTYSTTNKKEHKTVHLINLE